MHPDGSTATAIFALAIKKRGSSLKQWLLSCCVSLIAVGATFGLLQTLDLPPEENLPLFLFLVPVTVSAWFGRLSGGALATALSAIVYAFFFRTSEFSASNITLAQNAPIIIFLIEGLIMSVITAALRSSKDRVVEQKNLLRESGELASLLAESVREAAVYTLDTHGRVTSWNQGAERLYGYQESEIKGESYIRLYGAEDVKKGRPDEALAIAKREGRSTKSQGLRLRKDGISFLAQVTVVALKDNSGALRGFAEITRDVSEQAREREALDESENLFHVLADAVPLMIWKTGTEKLFNYLNAGWLNFTGRTLEQEQGDGWAEGIHPQDMRAFLAAFDLAFERRQNLQSEFRLRRADGEYRRVSCTGVPRLTSGGEFAGFVGACSDVTSHRQDEEERKTLLREINDLRQQLEAILKQTPAGVLIAEAPAGRVIAANNQFDQIWRYSSDGSKHQKRTFEYKGFHSNGKPYQIDEWPLVRSLKSGEVIYNEEINFERGDGTSGMMFVSSSPVHSAGGQIVAAVATFYDITARKVAERERAQTHARERMARREAEAANGIKDEFLATLSHELRTPLISMLGWVRMLRTGSLDSSNAARALETIQRSAQSQSRLIEELLEASRVAAGKMRLEVRPVELGPILEAAVDAVKPATDAKSINVQLMLEAGAGHISGDPDRLHQIFWNLLSNAIKFTPKDGHIAIKMRRDGPQVEVSISDTGIGIDNSFLPFVFERFRQADSSNTRAHSGLGLGLATVQHLVELHGGSVVAESRGTGQGAVFRVMMPASDASASLESGGRKAGTGYLFGAKNSDKSQMLEGVRVLVVDDEVATLNLLTVILQKHGASVTSVATAADAMKQLIALKPDVLVSDIQMPGENGYDLISKVRALGADQGGTTPAAALTASSGVEERMRALLAGFQIHVSKPIEPEELAAVVAALAKRPRPG